jgi:outer membrane receptor protein involved in Fe transport
MKKAVALAALVFAASLCQIVFGQTFYGTIVGQVADPSGAAIPNAAITLVEEATGLTQNLKSSPTGDFSVPNLPPGRYKITVQAQGFQKSVLDNIVLETQATRRVNVTMQVGDVSQSVTVNEELPVISTDTTNRGETIVQRQVQDLPLNGRNFTDLALTVPGVYPRPADDDQGEGLAVSGTRTDSTNFILDGVVNRSDRNGSVGVNTSIESIREFVVTTSTYSAEYGRNAGAQVIVTSKSGTNKLHGSVFEYLRNNVFDANNYFAPPDAPKRLQRNQFGASLGGKIKKDRTFYFGAYEGTREVRSEAESKTAPNAAWLNGDFRNVRGAGRDGILGNADDTNRIVDPFTKAEFPTPNVIPRSSFSPVSLKMLPYIPGANLPGSLEGYYATGTLRSQPNQYLVKVDHRFSDKNNFFARWAQQGRDGYDPFPSSRNYYPGFGRDIINQYNSLGFSDTHSFTPTILNEARFGIFWQENQNLGQNRDKDWIKEFGIPGLTVDESTQGWPAIRIDGYSEFGDRPNDPFIYNTKNFQWYDVVTWLKGKHSIKFGADIIRARYDEADVRNVRGDFRFRGRNTNPTGSTSTGFRSFADFLFGLPDATQRQIGAPPANLTGWQYAFFVQDDWRVSRNLTLNLGLRYELQMPLKEENNKLAGFIPGTGEVVQSGDPRYPDTLAKPYYGNFGPRAGFAWRPWNKTVIRAGAGMYYSLETFNVIRQQLAVTYPFVVREQYNRVSSNPGLLTFQNPFPQGAGAIQGLNTPFGMALDDRTPTIYQWNFTIEREIAKDLALDLGYVGSQGRFLGRRYNINQPIPTGLSSTGTLVTVRPYPQYGDIQFQDWATNSNYNAFQASLRRRYRAGLTMLVSYTFSRALDTASSTNNSTTGTQKFPQNVYDFASEKGLSDFHRAHQFTASYNYDLPFGRGRKYLNSVTGISNILLSRWSVNGVVSALSGRPFTPQYAAADIAQQRPDIVGDPLQNIPAGLRFNPAAFIKPVATAANPELYGNAGRNILIGPNFVSWNTSVHKEFMITEKSRLQFRAEAFNVLNHPNFQVPVFQLDQSNVAQVTSTANNNRELQLALKFLF